MNAAAYLIFAKAVLQRSLTIDNPKHGKRANSIQASQTIVDGGNRELVPICAQIEGEDHLFAAARGALGYVVLSLCQKKNQESNYASEGARSGTTRKARQKHGG